MSEINLINKDFLNTLEGFVEDFFAVPGYEDPKYQLAEERDQGLKYCDEPYLQECMALAEKGDVIGPPRKHFAQPIRNMVRVDPQKWSEYQQRVKFDFASEIGAHTSALLSYYPPGGYVGWHTNWDATAYQVLFTWSKNADGFFRYRDPNTGEIITIHDKPGWQARWYYFGDKPETYCWHCAYTAGPRITLAYKFKLPKDYVSEEEAHRSVQTLRDMLIDELETL